MNHPLQFCQLHREGSQAGLALVSHSGAQEYTGIPSSECQFRIRSARSSNRGAPGGTWHPSAGALELSWPGQGAVTAPPFPCNLPAPEGDSWIEVYTHDKQCSETVRWGSMSRKIIFLKKHKQKEMSSLNLTVQRSFTPTFLLLHCLTLFQVSLPMMESLRSPSEQLSLSLREPSLMICRSSRSLQSCFSFPVHILPTRPG